MVNLQTLKKEMIEAMKNKDKQKQSVLSVLIAEIDKEGLLKKAEKDGTLTAEKESSIVLSAIQSFFKKLQKSKKDFENNADIKARQFLADLEEDIRIVSAYLPAQLSESELTQIIQDIIETEKVDLAEKSSFGIVMSKLKALHQDNYDGGVAASVIKKLQG